LEKVRLVGDRVTDDVAPVPDRLAACGLPEALSVTERVALRVPEAVGANVTLIVQFPPAVTLEPQVLVCEKSPLFEPVIAILEIVSAAEPGLESVRVLAELEVPTCWLLKVKEAGDKVTARGTPILLTNASKLAPP
jgi:hypothetical protein